MMWHDDCSYADILAPSILFCVVLGFFHHPADAQLEEIKEMCARVALVEDESPPADFPDPCSLEAVTCDAAGIEDVGGE